MQTKNAVISLLVKDYEGIHANAAQVITDIRSHMTGFKL